jgi:D-serine deaminase-like pyridoxal phosphate-dependent protein
MSSLGTDTTSPTIVEPPRLDDVAWLATPALVLDHARVERNVQKMLDLARSVDRLRPHIKTHKMPAIVRMCEERGIRKHKCATIAEAEMAAQAGAADVLIAYPLVGPNLARFATLAAKYGDTTFRATVDTLEGAAGLSAAVASIGRVIPVLIDLDVGMGRTGIAPGEAGYKLARQISRFPALEFDGIHAYDGHLRDSDPARRERDALQSEAVVSLLRERLIASGIEVNRVVLGGTPTFPAHAGSEIPGAECSPGTCVLHDANYLELFPDLPFEPAAFLLTRVVSRTGSGRLCLDLGHKTVAPDSPLEKRVRLLGIPGARVVGQSEEHLVVEVPDAETFPPGTPIWAIPGHVCPTVALHSDAKVVRDGVCVDRWVVAARVRELTI